MEELVYKDECYKIIGICMEVHKNLGRGLSEILYKDALEFEFRMNDIPFQREKPFEVYYKNIMLPHKFYSDFVVYNDIILEIKATRGIADDFVSQILNYMSIAKSKLGLIINFGEESLKYKRLVI